MSRSCTTGYTGAWHPQEGGQNLTQLENGGGPEPLLCQSERNMTTCEGVSSTSCNFSTKSKFIAVHTTPLFFLPFQGYGRSPILLYPNKQTQSSTHTYNCNSILCGSNISLVRGYIRQNNVLDKREFTSESTKHRKAPLLYKEV